MSVSEETRAKVENGELSPIAYYMEKNLMDIKVLSGYTGFFRWTVRKHLKMKHFQRLSDAKLSKYAQTFEIDLKTLKEKKLL